MNGPILKDWQYYGFWTVVVLSLMLYLWLLKHDWL